VLRPLYAKRSAYVNISFLVFSDIMPIRDGLSNKDQKYSSSFSEDSVIFLFHLELFPFFAIEDNARVEFFEEGSSVPARKS